MKRSVVGAGVSTPTTASQDSDRARSSRPDDLCDARPGSLADRLGSRLSGLHPFVAGLVVVACCFVLVAGLVVGIGFLLTEVVLPGAVQRWDLDVVQELASGRPDLNDVSVVASYGGEFVTVLAVVGVTVALCLWRRRFALAWLYVIAITLEGFFYLTATYFVSRNRPNIPRLEDLINSDSYYSGHIAASVVVWVTLALIVWNVTDRRVPRLITLFLAVVAPIAVVLARLYRGMHHPTDALVGYLVGLACIGIALLAVRVFRVVATRRAEGAAS